MRFLNFIISKSFLINAAVAVFVLAILFWGTLSGLNNYTNHDERITVPDFTGLTFKDAKELAQQSLIKVQISDTTYSDETKRGLIAAQIPSMESIIKSERTVYLTINSLSAELVVMPNFRGASLRQAMVDCEIYGLKIGELSYVPDIAKNNVLGQKANGIEVAPGTLIEKGSLIDLILGMGLSNEKVFIPLVVNKSFLEADSMLRAKYLNTGAVFFDETVETAEDSATALIFQQQPEAFGKNFKPGDFVDLWFTIDSTKIVFKPEWLDSLNININPDTIPIISDVEL